MHNSLAESAFGGAIINMIQIGEIPLEILGVNAEFFVSRFMHFIFCNFRVISTLGMRKEERGQRNEERGKHSRNLSIFQGAIFCGCGWEGGSHNNINFTKMAFDAIARKIRRMNFHLNSSPS